MHLFAYLKHLIAARSLFSRKAFSSGREEKRGRAKGDYFSEIITFIAELQMLIGISMQFLLGLKRNEKRSVASYFFQDLELQRN